MTVEQEQVGYSRTRANAFEVGSVVVGLLATIFTAFVSLVVMVSSSDFIYNGGDWYRFTTGASKSIPAQACLWMSWFVAGLTCVYLGRRAVVRDRNIVWAFVIAVIMYEIGLDVTIEVALRGVDAAYRS
jgi:hypothetical protein